ncbi:MAG: hypothetical protein SCALA702_18470 [Melioribacteraceae bacterium]|nr:MAG: hypothetical protein SCALA702_18470 [Melioribacteraceae bacterium]
MYKDESKKLLGTFFHTGGEELKPLLVLLHGFPGNETNFDIAHAARRSGYNVLVFHYRGSWGSSGEYSWKNCLDDTDTIVKFIKTDEVSAKLKFDKDKIVFVGHSMGGFAAMMHSLNHPEVKNVGFLAGYNNGYGSKIISQKVEYVAEAVKRMNEGAALLTGTSGKQLWEEMFKNRDNWDLITFAKKLADKNILMVGAEFDTTAPVDLHHKPLAEALKKAGCENLEEYIIKTGHSFSDKRIKLTEIVLNWLNSAVKF